MPDRQGNLHGLRRGQFRQTGGLRLEHGLGNDRAIGLNEKIPFAVPDSPSLVNAAATEWLALPSDKALAGHRTDTLPQHIPETF